MRATRITIRALALLAVMLGCGGGPEPVAEEIALPRCAEVERGTCTRVCDVFPDQCLLVCLPVSGAEETPCNEEK